VTGQSGVQGVDMIADIDVFRAAQFLIDQHGRNASSELSDH
jgi:hypothetical protein